jgi:formyl-CoA transferase
VASKLLNGVSVLELGTMISAPVAGMMLADIGADVLKVEHPKGGDPFRNFNGGQYSPNFIAYNRNKRSMKLDLRSEAGREIFRRLLTDADVLLENYRPNVLASLGFGSTELQAINPRLIHCSVTGFGATGPYSERPAFDAVTVALSGVASLLLDPENPEAFGPTISDNVTGMYACYGILGALFERQHSGKGRRVEVNMLEASIAFMPDPVAHFTQTGKCFGPFTRVAFSQSYAFRCADDTLVALHLSIPDKFWQGLIAAIACPELATEEEFSTRSRRIENYPALKARLAKVFLTKSRAHWMAQLEANDVPFAPVHSIPEMMDDPQVVHLGTFCNTEHPAEGRVTAIRRPVLIDGERETVTAPPTLGEHTDAVLEKLGYAPQEIAAFRKAAIV